MLGEQTKQVIKVIRETYERNTALMRKIRESPWALEVQDLIDHFGCEMLGSVRFLRNLLNLSRLTPSFPNALDLIKSAREDRRSKGKARQGTNSNRLWMPCDVERAMLKNTPPRRTSHRYIVEDEDEEEEEDEVDNDDVDDGIDNDIERSSVRVVESYQFVDALT